MSFRPYNVEMRKAFAYCLAVLAVLGVTAYRVGFGNKVAKLGLQEETIGRTRVWILPNPSGLNAHYKPADFARVYGEARAYAATLG